MATKTLSVDAMAVPDATVPADTPNIVLVTSIMADGNVIRLAMTKDQALHLMYSLSEATK